MKSKKKKLFEIFRQISESGLCAAAFSGGVDSCVLAFALKKFGAELGTPVLALTARSASMPESEALEVERLAREIDIPHAFVPTQELELPEYRSNPRERCYFCKRHILGRLLEEAKKRGFTQLAEGSNADDLSDFRPGFQAVREWKVRSPLCEAGLTKSEVRQLAHEWKISTAEKPSTPCLASRIAYGIEISPERLHRVELAEKYLAQLGLSPLRVRVHEKELARIETDPEKLAVLLRPEIRGNLLTEFRQLGFSRICLDLGGFQSGSLNEG